LGPPWKGHLARRLIVTAIAFASGVSALSDLHIDGPRNRFNFWFVVLVNARLEGPRADWILRSETVAQCDRLARAY